MGAVFITHTFDGKKTMSQIQSEFKKLQRDAVFNARQEYGDDGDESYSGDWNTLSGIKFLSSSFTSLQEAENFLEHKAQKWEEALCAKYTEKNKEYWLLGGWASQ